MNVAFIPVRGGSKSIPLKNIKIINGKPLVYWTIRAACKCDDIDKVYVSTDSLKIKETVESIKNENSFFKKIEVIERSAESASDTASTESALLEFASKYDFENVVLIQATSPLLTDDDLSRGFEMFRSDGTDSVLSAVKQKRFIWNEDEYGNASPENYNYMQRPRRQEFEGYYVENGAFYITSRKRLIDSGNRISGNVKICQMSEESYYEIDEPSDWIIIEKILQNRESSRNYNSDHYLPKLFLMDCDGVLTDGGMYYSENGDEIKKFNTVDGMGIKLLHEKGIKVGIITGENRILNQRRAEKLKIEYLEQGVSDKLTVIKKICEKEKIEFKDVLYVGDDINDLEAIKNVGIGCTVANGRPEVKNEAVYITSAKGGDGAVREIVDWLLRGE